MIANFDRRLCLEGGCQVKRRITVDNLISLDNKTTIKKYCYCFTS